ncbi:hypothetical protein DPMN_123776 [Dreissena polymorpha]|uniref:RING-type domain-containing protein n=1 Tax=Dreissena polymorpha TaxID=45954 RepID=A0A9D4JVN2_DREPO|nr:hypothetical protein DPMN_123776 [Dreissena polymorpha]
MDRCPLCFETCQKPKLLPCLDTMCFTCLDEYVLKHARASGTFPCPVCGLELPVPVGGRMAACQNLTTTSTSRWNRRSSAHWRPWVVTYRAR